MPHKTFRAAATATTFMLGLAVVWLSGLLPPLETRLADWLVPDSEATVAPVKLVSREGSDAEQVYATVLREMFGGNGPLVVIASEAGGEMHCDTGYDLRVLDEIGTGAETMSDYCRSKPSTKLTRLPDVAAKQVFLSYEAYSKMFEGRGPNGWPGFYEKYPGSSGFISLSTIGFNGAGDEALLYASKSCGGLCGDGWYVLLRKGPDGWYIHKKKMMWVS